MHSYSSNKGVGSRLLGLLGQMTNFTENLEYGEDPSEFYILG